jgi:DNA-binding NtrC family response regulator
MARILINESHEQVRTMLVRMLTRLGHEPVVVTVPAPEQLWDANLFLIEPADPIGAVLVLAARLIDPSLPLVCASVAAPPADLAELGVEFAATLIKPFTAEQLGTTIDSLLQQRAAQRRHRAA